ncbi:MAG TPA: xanthine dehydrogenase family protein subunit M [Candidatus Eisenbacteria bacterium]|nr:xanthine dehydrogenase family protein subunit M [Candidatus Eisenbacteria bacterium]
MRSALTPLEIIRPKTLAEALAQVDPAGKNGASPLAVPLAGGTDLYVYLNAGTLDAQRFVDLWSVRELRGIRTIGEATRLGATTTMSQIREHPVLARRYPALAAAAAEVGGRQIQNRATIAGNIANASPAGDSLPALLAYDAIVQTRSARGGRTLPFESFYRGYRQLALAPGELIVAVDLPPPAARATHFFRKVGTRRAQSISKVVFAGLLRLDRDGLVEQVRLAYGSMAPVPLRARAAEEALLDEKLTAPAVARALAALERDLSPIDDIRSDREYRRIVAGNLLEQFLRIAAKRK